MNVLYVLTFQSEVCSTSLVDVLQAVVSGLDGCICCYGHARLGNHLLWLIFILLLCYFMLFLSNFFTMWFFKMKYRHSLDDVFGIVVDGTVLFGPSDVHFAALFGSCGYSTRGAAGHCPERFALMSSLTPYITAKTSTGRHCVRRRMKSGLRMLIVACRCRWWRTCEACARARHLFRTDRLRPARGCGRWDWRGRGRWLIKSIRYSKWFI